MLKKTLIGFVVLLIVVVGGLLIAPSFIDWNARLPEITAQVKAATGRDLTIDGRLEVRLLPAPMLTARGVKLGNASGASAPHMVALDAVEVRVALIPLLSGQVQVERIRLVKPQVYIETLSDGRTNLEFQTSASGVAPSGGADPVGAQPAASEGGAGLGVRLDNFEIIDAVVVYQDAAKGTTERIEGLNTILRATSLQGPFEAKGEVRLRGVPLSFEASLGQIIAGRTVPISAMINAPGGTRLQINGAALEMELAPRFKGKVKIEGTNLAALLGAVTGAGDAPVALKQTFALDTVLNATAKDIGLSELELQLGATRAIGAADVRLSPDVAFAVELKAARVDVDALLASAPTRSPSSAAAANASATGVAPQPPKSGKAGDGAGFALPSGVSGTVALSLDAVTFKGGLVSDVRLNAELADGELALSQFQLQAPGVTDVALFGFVKPEAGQPRFNGDLEVVTANPKGLTDWLGVQMPDGVAGRLKRVTFKTKVAADQSQVVLSAIDLTGDRTRLTGGVTVALRARPSFGADLRVDALNLDTYMNANGNGAAPAQAAASASAPTAQTKPQDKSQLGQAMDVAGMWAATAALNDFDANLKLRLDSLTHGGRTFKGVALDGTLYAGTLELRQFKLDDVLGASANLAGRFNGFGGVPEMTGVKADVKVSDANALATALGVAGVPPKIGAVTVGAQAEGSLLKPRLNVNVGALGGSYGAVGSLSLLPIGFGWSGDVTAKHGDAVNMLSRLGYTPTGPLGALNVKANVKSDGATHEVTALQGAIGDTALAGTITAKTGGVKPFMVANLTTGVLQVQRFLAKSDKRASLAPAANPLLHLASMRDAPQLAQAPSRADKRWSREAFDLSALNAVDGELTLKSDAIQFSDYRLDQADIHATINGGVMTADRVAGQLFGGPVLGTAVVRANGRPTIETTLKLSAMDVGRAVKAVAGKDLATGNLGLDLNFNATGLSPADLVSSLSGAGGLKIDALDVKQSGTGTALAPVIGLVAAMNQFALPATGGAGKSKGGLADLSLSFDIKDGVANAKNLALNSAFGSGTGAGRVDIAAWAIDFAGNMTVEPNLLTSLLSQGRVGRQEVPFSLKGALDKPGVNLAVRPAGAVPTPGGAGDPVQNLLQQVIPGVVPKPQVQPQPQPQPKPQSAPQPAPQPQPGGVLPPPPTQQPQAPSGGQQQPLTPEQMIKQLLKGR